MIRRQFSLTIFTHFISILPMAFTMMHFIQLHIGFLNYFFCRSLKIAQRFSIVNNCLKERNKTKEHEIKTGTK